MIAEPKETIEQKWESLLSECQELARTYQYVCAKNYRIDSELPPAPEADKELRQSLETDLYSTVYSRIEESLNSFAEEVTCQTMQPLFSTAGDTKSHEERTETLFERLSVLGTPPTVAAAITFYGIDADISPFLDEGEDIGLGGSRIFYEWLEDNGYTLSPTAVYDLHVAVTLEARRRFIDLFKEWLESAGEVWGIEGFKKGATCGYVQGASARFGDIVKVAAYQQLLETYEENYLLKKMIIASHSKHAYSLKRDIKDLKQENKKLKQSLRETKAKLKTMPSQTVQLSLF
ncbi:MAG: hypothetical protein ACKO24_10895 [Leptolyngbyaceae cyanobacterium]